ncbi:MAG: hypothetical protein Q8M81_11975 [Sediminibacterium sp.]|nr:hypothetical protein [Sediminibacterium sp.]
MAFAQTPQGALYASYIVTVSANGIVVSPFVRQTVSYPKGDIYVITNRSVHNNGYLYQVFINSLINPAYDETFFEIWNEKRILEILLLVQNGRHFFRYHFGDDSNGQVTIFREFDVDANSGHFNQYLQTGLNAILQLDQLQVENLLSWF